MRELVDEERGSTGNHGNGRPDTNICRPIKLESRLFFKQIAATTIQGIAGASGLAKSSPELSEDHF